MLKHALTLDPNHPEALRFRAVVLSAAGQESTVEATRLLEVDPLSPFNQIAPAWGHFAMGRFAQAVDLFRCWCRDEPDHPLAAMLLGDVLARTGSREEAITVFDQLARRLPEAAFGQLALFLRRALDGDRGGALAAVTPTLMEWARLDFEASWEMATGYALIGETDDALEWLENAVQRGFINYPFLSKYDPLLENLREEKRFLTLMDNVRFQWEQFEV